MLSGRLTAGKLGSRRRRGTAARDWHLGSAGLTTLDFVLVSGVFFLLLFGAMDVARYFLTWHGLNTIVSEAARASMINNWTYSCGHPTAGTAATIASSAPFLDTSQLQLCVTSSVSSGQTTVSVTASYPFSFMISLLSGADGTLTASTALTY
jgi:Flp pilus assembly protein TadG